MTNDVIALKEFCLVNHETHQISNIFHLYLRLPNNPGEFAYCYMKLTKLLLLIFMRALTLQTPLLQQFFFAKYDMPPSSDLTEKVSFRGPTPHSDTIVIIQL